jgi:class 3 adenylate cyclase
VFPRDPARRDNGEVHGEDTTLRVRLLGPFLVSAGDRVAGPWPRPIARRLCQLVLVSPGRRISRDLACEELFADLDPRAAARTVSKALSMTRAALADLGGTLLEADLTHIWAAPGVEVDADGHEQALREALSMSPGQGRDDRFTAALAQAGDLLADEPYADWAVRPRERLEALRLEARLTLARDRSKGAGQSRPEQVIAAWEDCFDHDPASEEAAIALVRAHFAQGRRELAAHVYERCGAALAELGLRMSPALEEAYATAGFEAGPRGPAATAAPAAPVPVRLREELRTVSILSADLAMPARLAAELGLEALREVVAGSVATVIGEVEALGGMVTSVSGSGVQAMFGAPEAHEDDPERAARAAFRALAASASATPMLRIGIETGPAVLGPIGAGAKVEYGAVGEVVSVAAALQARARPGSALVGPATRAAIGHLFSWGATEDVPPLTASYLGEPRPGATGRRSRRGAMVGRRAEMAALEQAMRDVVGGRGSVVVVTGEPGLGKTRLMQECRKRMTGGNGRPPIWLEGRCASYASSSPYGLYQQLLAVWAGVTADQPEAVVRPALERALTTVMGNLDLFPLLARMMGLSPGAALGRMGPEELQRATFAAWRSVLSRLVAAAPTVLVLEDLHWADPTSLRLTLDLAGLAAGRRLLVLATSRPGAGPEVAGLPARRIALGPLPGDAERALARSLIGEEASHEVLDAVLASVEGNPLYMEERLSSLLETETLVREHGEWRVNAIAGQDVPHVLERLVHSRVDRLSAGAREAIRPASVLGTEFPLSLLAAVYTADDPLAPALDELCAKDLLEQVDGLAEPAFRFRHALIQEATYSGLPRAERRLLHGRAAWALESASSGRLADVAAVLGRHFAAAAQDEQALRYFEMAGDHATAAFANDEAISSFLAAMDVADRRPAGADARVDLRAKLANVLWRIGRRDEAREAFVAALRLPDNGNTLRRAHLHTRLGRLEMADLRYEAAAAAFESAGTLLGDDPGSMDDATAERWLELMLDGWAALHSMRDQPGATLEILDEVGPALAAKGSPPRRYAYHMHGALARIMLKRYHVDEADLTAMRQALAAAAQGDEEKDLGYARYFLGWMLWLHGDLAEAGEHMAQAVALAERIGESILLAESLLGLTLIAVRRHDVGAVRALVPPAQAAAEAMAGQEYEAGARACLTWLAWQDGDAARVIALAGESAELMARIDPTGRWVYLLPLLAAHLAAGNLEDGVAVARELLDPAQRWLPDALTSAMAAAASAWDHGNAELTMQKLAAVLSVAHELRYF